MKKGQIPILVIFLSLFLTCDTFSGGIFEGTVVNGRNGKPTSENLFGCFSLNWRINTINEGNELSMSDPKDMYKNANWKWFSWYQKPTDRTAKVGERLTDYKEILKQGETSGENWNIRIWETQKSWAKGQSKQSLSPTDNLLAKAIAAYEWPSYAKVRWQQEVEIRGDGDASYRRYDATAYPNREKAIKAEAKVKGRIYMAMWQAKINEKMNMIEKAGAAGEKAKQVEVNMKRFELLKIGKDTNANCLGGGTSYI